MTIEKEQQEVPSIDAPVRERVTMRVLRDGTALSDLVDHEARTVQLRAISDPEIFEWEMENIFTKQWTVVAHETELPNPGDYVSRSMGTDPVVVTRDADGAIRVLLNSCSHRGSPVCRAEAGNARRFTCPYHGWVYDTAGKLTGVPGERKIYGKGGLDKSAMGLPSARVEIVHGWVFANWDPVAPDLRKMFGDFMWYFDLLFKRTKRGQEVLGPPMRWVVKGNWKLAVEQFSGDAYHGMMAHRSLLEIRDMVGNVADTTFFQMNWPLNDNGMAGGFTEHAALKNAFADQPEMAEQIVAWMAKMPPTGVPMELMDEVEEVLTAEQRRWVSMHGTVGGAIFPNFAWAMVGPSPDASASVAPRIFIPRGPDETEMVVWILVEKDAPQKYKDLIRAATVRDFSSSGQAEQDDIELWGGIQKTAHGALGRRRVLDYRARNEFAEADPAEWPGPIRKRRIGPVQRDDSEWNFWRRWYEVLTTDDAPGSGK